MISKRWRGAYAGFHCLDKAWLIRIRELERERFSITRQFTAYYGLRTPLGSVFASSSDCCEPVCLRYIDLFTCHHSRNELPGDGMARIYTFAVLVVVFIVRMAPLAVAAPSNENGS